MSQKGVLPKQKKFTTETRRHGGNYGFAVNCASSLFHSFWASRPSAVQIPLHRIGHELEPVAAYKYLPSPRLRVSVVKKLGEVQSALEAAALVGDFFLQQGDGVDQLLGAWRAAGDVNVYGDDLVDALHQRVIIEDAA